MLCQGSIVSGATVRGSIIGTGSYIDEGAEVVDSIVFPEVYVGPGARLNRCVVDKSNLVPPGYRVGHDAEEDATRFTVSEGGIAVLAKSQRLEAP
jgi:glucose-1-phosphate adenylyltransferase